MASKSSTRLDGLGRPLTQGGRLRALLAVAAMATAGAAALVALPHSTQVPHYLEAALGPMAEQAPLAQQLADRSSATVRHDGFALAQSGNTIDVASVVDGAGTWSRHSHRLVRRTSRVLETIRVGKAAVEESLVVAHHVGRRTWRWRLSG